MINIQLSNDMKRTLKNSRGYKVVNGINSNINVIKQTQTNTKIKTYDKDGNWINTVFQPKTEKCIVYTGKSGDVYLRFLGKDDISKKYVAFEKVKINSLADFIRYIKSKADLIF